MVMLVLTKVDSIESLQQRCNLHLAKVLKQQCKQIEKVSPPLMAAIDYSAQQGGKRIRPLLVYASALAADGSSNVQNRLELADDIAVAIEMIHAYSLIHDDLPAMDDDDLRRGMPSCHVQYGEALAILAGDTLQALAFSTLVSALKKRESINAFTIMDCICRASIAMVSGQALDICSVGSTIDEPTLRNIHSNKTGALIAASVLTGYYSTLGTTQAKAEAQYTELFIRIGELLGLAFQVQDDLLDLEVESATLGKPQGSDQAGNKPTYPAVIGLEEAREFIDQLHEQAMSLLHQLPGDSNLLQQVCIMLSQRKH